MWRGILKAVSDALVEIHEHTPVVKLTEVAAVDEWRAYCARAGVAGERRKLRRAQGEEAFKKVCARRIMRALRRSVSAAKLALAHALPALAMQGYLTRLHPRARSPS